MENMAPDSLAAQLATLAAVLITAAATAYLWERMRGRAFVLRPVAVVLCVASAGMAGLVAVNREVEMFGSWSDLVGAVQPAAEAPATSTGGVTGSQVVSMTVTGPASHLTMTAFVYLPAGYAQAPLNGEALPVIEAFDGFPGTPMTWLHRMRLQQHLDTEIAAHRMPPTVVVLPYQTPDLRHDTECVDARGGPAADTFLTQDLPAAVEQRYRVRTDPAAWGVIGYSTGGFCAVNLAMRHPDRYGAAVSLSGYFQALTDHTTGDLYHGDVADRDANSPVWRLQHLPVPPLPVYLASARDDRYAIRQMRMFAAAVQAPMRLTTATTKLGGHTIGAWMPMLPPALDWLGSWLAGPLPAGSSPAATPTPCPAPAQAQAPAKHPI
jgi:enterochelin esterase-like enzyme